jgi:serine/threonine protein kinase
LLILLVLLYGTKLEIEGSAPTFIKLEAKIADAGILSKSEEEDDSTLRWMAPEIPKGRYSTPADIYSFGLLVWYYWCGRQPFENLNSRQLPPQNGLRPPIPTDCPLPWANLMER